ncbi:MAG: class I SAM-dependent methyltransferase [Chloroflexi bacterium]|nr:class I SAM-dependent methyltransferase [Chloroflexota bacterium]
MKSLLKRLAGRLPGLHTFDGYLHPRHTSDQEQEPFSRGHFHSPLPDYTEVKSRAPTLFSKEVDLGPSIQLRADAQLALLADLASFYEDFDWPEQPSPNRRFYLTNPFFGHGDAIILYMMLRYLRPKRIIEVGSGFSSALMLDINEKFLDRSVTFTFIEPFSERLMAILHDDDWGCSQHIQDIVQRVPISTFGNLGPNDILFIDSSHVSKIGSDVNFIIFEVLPALKPGVAVHFHDILWPFEYPETWIMQGVAWNEAYILRAFLQYNDEFDILLFNSYVGYKFAFFLRSRMPRFLENTGGSLWLRK